MRATAERWRVGFWLLAVAAAFLLGRPSPGGAAPGAEGRKAPAWEYCEVRGVRGVNPSVSGAIVVWTPTQEIHAESAAKLVEGKLGLKIKSSPNVTLMGWLGEQGWELVNTTVHLEGPPDKQTENYTWVFKRPR
jgi:hypothetical protein